MESTSLIPASVEARPVPLGRMPVGFGVRFFIALALGLVWIVPAWWRPEFAAGIAVWDACVLLAWWLDLRSIPRASEIEIARQWERAPSLALPCAVRIALRNRGASAFALRLTDETTVMLRDVPPTMETIVRPNQEAAVDYDIRPRERGNLAMGRSYLRLQSPVGLAERRMVADLRQTVRVLPDLEQAKSQALYLIRSRQVEMERRRKRQRGAGREFEALREYRQGDEMRDICWPATARRHHLVTRVYQVERSQAVWIVLDAGRLMRARVEDPERDFRLTKLDYAVNAAVSLAHVASQTGDRVGLLVYGRTIQGRVGLGRGAAHLRSIIEALAQARAEASEADHGLAVRTLMKSQTRRSLVIWVTDFPETPSTPEVIEYAAKMTERHLVVFGALTQPDLIELAGRRPSSEDEMFRHAVAVDVCSRREALLGGLRERGVLALDLPPQESPSALVDRYLEVKERGAL